MTPWHRRGAIFLLLLMLSYVPFLKLVDEEPNGSLWGDATYYALACESLLVDRDVKIGNNLDQRLIERSIYDRQLAIDKNSSLTLKHSPVFAYLVFPFYLVAGTRGLLIANILFMALLGVMLFELARRYSTDIIAGFTAYLLGMGTLLLPYVYNVSPDLLSGLLLTSSLLSLRRLWYSFSGLLIGLAVAIKLSSAPIALALAFATACTILAKRSTTARDICALVGGLCAGLTPYLWLNYVLFGSPFTTGYQRIATITELGLQVVSHTADFQQPLLTGISRVLIDSMHGILATNPILFIGLWGVFPMLRHPHRNEAFSLLVALCAQVVFIAKYNEWNVSSVSNRFLIFAVTALTPFITLSVQQLCKATTPTDSTPDS